MYMAQRRNLSIGITINLDNYENLRLEVSGEVCGDEDTEDLITYLDGILSRLGRGTPETAERVDAYRKRVLSLPPSPLESAPLKEAPTAGEIAGQAVPAPGTSLSAPPTLKITKAMTAPIILPEDKKTSTPPSVSPVKEPVPYPAVTKEMAGKKEAIAPPPLPEIKKAIPVPPPATGKDVLPPVKKETAVPPVSAGKREPLAPAPSPKPVPAAAESPELPKQETFSCERCGEPITPVQRKLSRMFQNKDLCKKCLQQL
jgi:hypothetical protein